MSRRKRLSLLVALALAAFLARTSAAAARADGSAAAASGSPELERAPEAVAAGYVSPWVIGYADFVPQSSGSEACLYDAPTHGGAAFLAGDSPGGTCCVVAPVHFPDGATVTAAFFYIRDESGADLTMSLRRKRLDDFNPSTILATATTNDSSSAIRIFSDATISNAVVDNTHYAYFVSSDTCLDHELDLRLYHVLLFYSE